MHDFRDERFTEEALKAQDGKKLPLTLGIGGPVIGEATLRYVPESGELIPEMRIDDPEIAELVYRDPSAVIFGKES